MARDSTTPMARPQENWEGWENALWEEESDTVYPSPEGVTPPTFPPGGLEERESGLPEIPGFDLLRRLGESELSQTYLGCPQNDKKRLLVIKLEPVKDGWPSFLENEAHILCAMDSPRIIKILPMPEPEETLDSDRAWIGRAVIGASNFRYILLKYMPGGSLQDLLKSQTHPPLAERGQNYPLSLTRITEIVDQVAEAIDYAHRKDIVHLDLKPSNILFSFTRRRVVVSDFGIAQAMQDGYASQSYLMGTPNYIAPETLDEENLGLRADIYSLGIILAEMLLGRMLTLGTGGYDRIADEIRALPRELRNIVRKATHFDPQRRYPTAASLAADLRRSHRQVLIKARMVRASRRLRPIMVLAGSGALAIAVFTFLFWLLGGVLYPLLSDILGSVDILRWAFSILTAYPVVTGIVLVVLSAVWVYVYQNHDGILHHEPEYVTEDSELYDLAPAESPWQPGPPVPPTRLTSADDEYGTVTRGFLEVADRTEPDIALPTPSPFVPSVPPSSIQDAPSWATPEAPAFVAPPSSEEVPIGQEYSPLASMSMRRGPREGIISYELTESRTTIGRGSSCEIILPDQAVSMHHAVVVRERNEFVLYDLDSHNGTYANNRRVMSHPLQDEDQIVIGGTLLQFNHTRLYTDLRQLQHAWSDYLEAIDENDRERTRKASERLCSSMTDRLEIPKPQFMSDSRYFQVFMLNTESIFAETRLSVNLPIALSSIQTPSWDDFQQLQRDLGQKVAGPSFQFLLVLPVEHVHDEEHGSLISAAQSRSLDLVLLGGANLERLLLSRKPRHALRREILAHAQLRSGLSPYVEAGPTGGAMFFGRDRELRDISEQATQRSFAVLGGRRIGKTSVLFRLHQVQLPKIGFRTIYYDCSTVMDSSGFLTTSIRDWQPNPPADPSETFGDLLKNPPNDKPLVLLLDEIDRLIPADRAADWQLFKRFRAMANQHNAQFVLCGERTLRGALRDPTSPLYNFANTIFLGPLDYTAVEELVTRPMKQLEIELIEPGAIMLHIYQFTSGHPNVVQRLCRRLIDQLDERGERRVSLEDVRAITEDPGFQREDFLNTYWEAALPLEKIICLLMAEKEELWTLSTVRQALEERCNLGPTSREVDAALLNLVELRSLLRKTQAGYEFAVEAFPRIVAGTMTLADMLEILTEEYQGENE